MPVNYKIIAVFIGLLILLAGCLGFETQLPVVKESPSQPAPNLTSLFDAPTVAPTPAIYVMCDDYVKITDRYKTPEGFYIVAGNDTISLNESQYMSTVTGGYVKAKIDYSMYHYYVPYDYTPYYTVLDSLKDLIPVTEKESGYRFACRAVRE